jgi:hypothetical protein
VQEEEKQIIKIGCLDMSVWHGYCHIGLRIGFKCYSKTDMGDHGKTKSSLANYSDEIGELA